MKVLHIFNEINHSGAEVMYCQAAPLLQEQGITSIALSTGPNFGGYVTEMESANVPCFHLPLLKGIINKVNYAYALSKMIKEMGVDVIHVHREPQSFIFYLSGFLAKVGIVRTFHNVFYKRRITWIKGYLERLLSKMVFNVLFHSISESVQKHEKKYFFNETTRVNNWVDFNLFMPIRDENEKSLLRKQFGIDVQSVVLISVGRCTEVKNHSEILHALKVLSVRYNIHYIHVGTGCLEMQEKALAEQLDISDFCSFVGQTNRVRDYYVASDIHVMTSKFEGLGNVAVESMACNVFNVLYDVPGLRDIIKNNDVGYLIEPNLKKLIAALESVINDEDTRKTISCNAHNYVKKIFNIGNVRDIAALYRIVKND